MYINSASRNFNYREVYTLRRRLYNNKLFFYLFITTIIRDLILIINYIRE